MIQPRTIETFAKDFESIELGTRAQRYTFEQEQGDDLIEVSATINPMLDLLKFDVVFIDLFGNRRDSELSDYQTLYEIVYARLNDLYEEVRYEIQ